AQNPGTVTSTNPHWAGSPATPRHSRVRSAYVPATATTVPPYNVVVVTLPGPKSGGMNTTDRIPALAAAAATALARLPVDAQDRTLKPNDFAAEAATATTRSLNEWVG